MNTRNLAPFEAVVGFLAGLALASLGTGLSVSVDPALRSVEAIAREPWLWVMAFGAVLTGGLGWIVGDQRREAERTRRTYQTGVEAEFARLADQEWMTRAVVRAVLDAVLLVDNDGVVLDANPEACRLFGAAPEALVGRPITGLLPDRPTLVPGVEEGDVEIATARHADGSRFRVEVRAAVLESPPVRILTLREDTWRRQLAESRGALERMEGREQSEARRRSQVLLEVDHGLRQDLSRLLRTVEGLQSRGVPVEGLLVGTFAMIERLERLLDLTLWDRAVGAPERRQVPIVEVFDHTAEIVAPIAQRRGRSVLVDVDPGLGGISTDMSLVAGTVRALVREVLDRTGGDVVVEVAREPGRDNDWLLVTTALGVRLDDAETARIAALLESTPSTLPDGRDSSLVLGQRLARHLGGRIVLRPQLTERGTTFGLSLPLSAERARPSRVPLARSEQPTPP